jgi:hypothetical protein
MANTNFTVHNGLTVGPAFVYAGNGDIITSGNISVINGGSFGGLSSNQIYSGSNNVTVGGSTVNISISSSNVASFSSTGLTLTGNLSVAGNTFFVNTTIINTTDTLQAPTIITGSGGVYPNANASVNLGTTSAYWNNVYAVNFLGTSTTAKYADLAERYSSDADYEPGTVVDFGGTAEVTLSDIDGSQYVAGVVSTNPAYMMNSDADGLYIALTGRVPTKVTGPIEKGAMMVSNGDGTARMERNPKIGSVIGKALQSFGDGVGVIEVVVGRL